MKTLYSLTAVIFMLGCFVFMPVANAASDSANHTVTFVNTTAMEVSITGGNVDLGTAGPATNATDSSTSLLVKSNAGYSVTVVASGNFDNTINQIPVSRLSADLGDGVVVLSTLPQTVYDNNITGTIEAGESLTIGYSLDLQYDDAVGTGFVTTITYTASN